MYKTERIYPMLTILEIKKPDMAEALLQRQTQEATFTVQYYYVNVTKFDLSIFSSSLWFLF
jgi:hypothetical protein